MSDNSRRNRITKSVIIKLLILIILLAMGIIFNAPSQHDVNPFKKSKDTISNQYNRFE